MKGQHRSVEAVSPDGMTFCPILKNSVFKNASLAAAGFGHPRRLLERERSSGSAMAEALERCSLLALPFNS